MSAECIRLGRYQDVLADVDGVDLLLVDAPYSERTHVAQRTTESRDKSARKAINYTYWSPADVHEFVDFWCPRSNGWIVSVTDHGLAPVWADALDAVGRYVFAPVPFVAPGSRVRLAGDGPSTWTCWLVVGRPRAHPYAKWGTLPGAYVLPPGESGNEVMGGKPLWLGRALVRDYSRPGDLVVDPCCGGGTFPLAALMEGRRALAAECLPEHFAVARKRLARGFTPTLFSETAAEPEQLKLGEP